MRQAFLAVFVAVLAGTGPVLGQDPDVLPPPRMVPTGSAAEGTPAAETAAGTVPADALLAGAGGPDGGPSGIVGAEVPPGPHTRVWFSAEYLMWWFKGQPTPPLVTVGPAEFVLVPGLPVPFGPPPLVAVAPPATGAVGIDGDQVLFGGRGINQQSRSGARFTAGFWLDDAHSCAVEGNYFFLGDRSNNALFGPELRVLARPFFDLNTATETAALVTFPGETQGSLLVSSPSRLWGTEGNLVKKLCACDCQYQINCLAGFRYLDLEEEIVITQSQDISAGLLPSSQFFPLAGEHLLLTDRFAAVNKFYGGQLGLDTAYYCGCWAMEGRVKLGLGDTHESLTVLGSQTVTAPSGATTRSSAGLLAVASNSGHFTKDQFALVPEATLHIGYRICDKICLFAGYDFLYWSQVVRPGPQIDRVVDVALVPNFAPGTVPTGAGHPATIFKQSDFWAHGVDVGVEFVW
ncbi:MAG TPA: BBP7 family outer membrane beta-barrel protein [Gemmataceae bacterium]|jgi:hypothetical protein|nr:BBP7 family outer membrane beta-barrel protein [Gemmataceae bacterium]